MSRSLYRSLLIVLVGMALCLAAAPAARAANPSRPLEAAAVDLEGVLQQLLASSDIKPVFANLGDGFYSMSVTLPDEVRDRLIEALAAGSADGLDPITGQATGPTFVTLAAGQQLTDPANPSTCLHAALSQTNLSYNYWVVVLNLNAQSLTKKTTLNLSGPKKFSKTVNIDYGGNAIWVIWYNPGVGVGTPGVYTLKATVSGGGTVSTKSFAINP